MDKTKLAHAITKALAYTENGGKPNTKNPSKGKTGEMASIFQFTPDTWKHYSQQILGNANAPMNADSETYVVNKKVEGWLDKGYKPAEIASMWNAGVGEPEAYSGKFSDGSPSVGVNKKYNVKFDVPGYAKKVEGYTKTFLQGGDQQASAQGATESPEAHQALQNVLATIQGAKQAQPPVQTPGTPQPGAGVPGMLNQPATA